MCYVGSGISLSIPRTLVVLLEGETKGEKGEGG